MFTVSNFCACDYVRQEVGGKYTCIGVYPNATMAIADFLIPITISFYVEITSSSFDAIDVHFILEDRTTNRIFSSFPAKVKLNGFSSPPLATFPIEIKPGGPCRLHFSAITGDQKIELGDLAIFEVQPNATPRLL